MNWQVIRGKVHVEPFPVEEARRKIKRFCLAMCALLFFAAAGSVFGTLFFLYGEMPRLTIKARMDAMEANNLSNECIAENRRLGGVISEIMRSTKAVKAVPVAAKGNMKNIGGEP